MRRLSLILLPAVLVAGCAPMPPPATDPAARAAIERQLTELRQQQANMAGELRRVQEHLVLAEGQLRDQRQALQEMRAALQAEKVTPDGEKAASTPAAAADLEGKGATETYLQAFADFAAARYPQAVAGFDAFLRRHGDHDYAGHALYWLGECYFAQQQYPAAIEVFAQVTQRYPHSAKAPDALLKLAAALWRTNDERRAGEVLQQLREGYPESAAVRKIDEIRPAPPFTKETQ